MATADNKLIHELIKRSQKNSKLIRHTDYVAPNVPMMTIRSWKMNEYKYKVVPSPFPTLARGLFTTEVDQGRRSSGKAKEYRIVVRGYDKFFNIGEVPWTRVCDVTDSVRVSPRLTGCVPVGLSGSPYRATIHPLPKVKRLHHLHRRSQRNKTSGHFKTFCWTSRQCSTQSLPGWRRVVAQAP